MAAAGANHYAGCRPETHLAENIMNLPTLGGRNTENQSVLRWVEAQARLCQPDKIFWCNGSEIEKETLTAEAVEKKILVKLNQEKLPGCYYHRSNSNDVARVEQCTFICTPMQEEAGPTNNWMAPKAMYAKLRTLCDGAMKGRHTLCGPSSRRRKVRGAWHTSLSEPSSCSSGRPPPASACR